MRPASNELVRWRCLRLGALRSHRQERGRGEPEQHLLPCFGAPRPHPHSVIIRRCRKQAPVRGEGSNRSSPRCEAWADIVAESAVLAHVVNERPGATVAEIATALGIDRDRAERGTAALIERRLLEERSGHIVPAAFSDSLREVAESGEGKAIVGKGNDPPAMPPQGNRSHRLGSGGPGSATRST